MPILVTVLARKNSKSLPNKNIRPMCGKPLIQWTIDQAVSWGRGRVVVSTDYPGNIVNGIDIIRRPKHLTSDDSPKMNSIMFTLVAAEFKFGCQFDVIVDLDVTNPLRTVEDIENCYNIFLEKRPDVVFSVTECRRNPYFNQVEVVDGAVKLCKYPPTGAFRRQDVPPVYDMNASIYVYSRRFLCDLRHVVPTTGICETYQMPFYTGIDIDTQEDWDYVESILSKRGG